MPNLMHVRKIYDSFADTIYSTPVDDETKKKLCEAIKKIARQSQEDSINQLKTDWNRENVIGNNKKYTKSTKDYNKCINEISKFTDDEKITLAIGNCMTQILVSDAMLATWQAIQNEKWPDNTKVSKDLSATQTLDRGGLHVNADVTKESIDINFTLDINLGRESKKHSTKSSTIAHQATLYMGIKISMDDLKKLINPSDDDTDSTGQSTPNPESLLDVTISTSALRPPR
jgi:hypothetical protein